MWAPYRSVALQLEETKQPWHWWCILSLSRNLSLQANEDIVQLWEDVVTSHESRDVLHTTSRRPSLHLSPPPPGPSLG